MAERLRVAARGGESVVDDLPAPPYPAGTLAKGWRFELDRDRMLRSDTWALAHPEARPWLLMQWVTAWGEAPCGSLPDDDDVIRAKLGMSYEAFTQHRTALMRGWWKAADGRLYHRTLTERVAEMLVHKDGERSRKAAWRASKRPNVPTCPTGQTGDGHGKDDTGTGTGTGTSTSSTSLRSVEEQAAARLAILAALRKHPTPPLRFAPSNATFVRAVAAGADVERFIDTHAELLRARPDGVQFAYLAGTVLGRIEDEARTPPARPGRAPPKPAGFATKDYSKGVKDGRFA